MLNRSHHRAKWLVNKLMHVFLCQIKTLCIILYLNNINISFWTWFKILFSNGNKSVNLLYFVISSLPFRYMLRVIFHAGNCSSFLMISFNAWLYVSFLAYLLRRTMISKEVFLSPWYLTMNRRAWWLCRSPFVGINSIIDKGSLLCIQFLILLVHAFF